MVIPHKRLTVKDLNGRSRDLAFLVRGVSVRTALHVLDAVHQRSTAAEKSRSKIKEMGSSTDGKGEFFYSNEDMFFPTKIPTFVFLNLLSGTGSRRFPAAIYRVRVNSRNDSPFRKKIGIHFFLFISVNKNRYLDIRNLIRDCTNACKI